MLRRDELNRYLDDLLETARFDDYAPNGLQVEGAQHISTLVTGVTASRALVDAALQAGAEALLVHHGYFWRGEDPRIVGMKRARLAPLLAHDINLFAYHLPLDAHADYGNNVQLARVLELSVLGRFGPSPQLGLYGMTAAPITVDEYASHLDRRLARAPLGVAGGAQLIRKVGGCLLVGGLARAAFAVAGGGLLFRIGGWCSGAAVIWLVPAAAAGLDAFF